MRSPPLSKYSAISQACEGDCGVSIQAVAVAIIGNQFAEISAEAIQFKDDCAATVESPLTGGSENYV